MVNKQGPIPRSGAILTASIDASKVITMLDGFQRTIPEAADIGVKALAGVYAMKYLEQMPRAKSLNQKNQRGIESWTGRSFSALERQITNPTKIGNGYGILVPSSLIALDQMDAHRVTLFRSKNIGRWAKTKLGIETGPFTKKKITVYPHPWIQDANRNASKFIKIHPRKEIKKALVRKGR
ncbi:MAG: hypothetical protein CMH64_01770 [Nanoarchaeota archaeon]|jgi:hypothetical protein|nr:hypothetical protein [Nanoarchaeota archaeon]